MGVTEESEVMGDDRIMGPTVFSLRPEFWSSCYYEVGTLVFSKLEIK